MNYTPILVLTFDDSGVPVFITMMVFCLFYSVKSTQVSVATSLSFYNVFSTWKCSKKNWTKALVLHVFHAMTKSTFFSNAIRLVIAWGEI